MLNFFCMLLDKNRNSQEKSFLKENSSYLLSLLSGKFQYFPSMIVETLVWG